MSADDNGVVTPDTINRAFRATERGFTARVEEMWPTQPKFATVGACCLVGVICQRTLYVANLGDSRVVLGKKVGDTGVIAAIQLSTEHNANVVETRRELKELHSNDPHIVVLKHGVWRVKGIIQGEAINARASELKEEVRMIFNNVVEPLDQLELIYQLQRLGLDYHFCDEINRTLKKIHTGQNNETWEKDLHATALEFRLLRQHGHYIFPEGFKRFTGNRSFSKGIRADVQGLLSLLHMRETDKEMET